MAKPSFEMIQSNRSEIEKALLSGGKHDSVAHYLSFVVLVEINVPPLSVLWELCVFFFQFWMLTCWEADEQKCGVFIHTFTNAHTVCTQLRRDGEKTQVSTEGRRTHSKTHVDSLSFECEWMSVRVVNGLVCLWVSFCMCMFDDSQQQASTVAVLSVPRASLS